MRTTPGRLQVLSRLSSYGFSAFGIADGFIAVGMDPASMRAELELAMSIFGTLPVVNRLSLGYDMGKAAAYTIDAFGGFDWWVAQDFGSSYHAKNMSHLTGAYGCAKIGSC